MSADLELSAVFAAARLTGIVALLDAVAPGASVLFYGSVRPAAGVAPVETPAAVVPLAVPCGTVGDPAPDLGITPVPLAVLALDVTPPPEGQVESDVTLVWCRIVDGAGAEHLRCNVGATGSGALIEVDALNVYAGGYVRITGGVFY